MRRRRERKQKEDLCLDSSLMNTHELLVHRRAQQQQEATPTKHQQEVQIRSVKPFLDSKNKQLPRTRQAGVIVTFMSSDAHEGFVTVLILFQASHTAEIK